jgi:hypothetical protein
MRPFAFAALIAVGLSAVPTRAEAITVREVIQLSRAGLGEEVLLALIEIDQRVFPIDPETLRMLKEAGVSEKVIVAMVKSGRTPPPAPVMPDPLAITPPPPAPEPQVVVIEHDRPVVREVPVAVPVYVAVPTHRFPQTLYNTGVIHPRTTVLDNRTLPPDNRTVIDGRPVQQVKPAEPVYWGWGGQRRPDSWQPSPAETRRDQRRDK